jgi:MFS family permease
MSLLLAATSAFAAYPARDLVIPIAGRATDASGRRFLTALWLTNTDERSASSVILTFLPSGKANRSPRQLRLTLGAGASQVLDPLDSRLLGAEEALGAVRVKSTTNVVAHARVYTSGGPTGSMGMGFAAIPTRHAIGNGQAAVLQGIMLGESRYRLFIVETAGAALSIAITLHDLGGRTVAEKRIYVDTFEHIRTDVRELFPTAQIDRATLHIRGVNGNGRVVVAGAQIAAGSEDPSAFEMSFAPEPRSHIGWPEAAVYLAVAAVVIMALFKRR